MKFLNKLLLNSAIILSLAGCSNDTDLTEEDFAEPKCDWIEYDNRGSGKIWSNYMFEDVFRSTHNWYLYQYKVYERNGEDLNKIIEIPDLDHNGIVGKK